MHVERNLESRFYLPVDVCRVSAELATSTIGRRFLTPVWILVLSIVECFQS